MDLAAAGSIAQGVGSILGGLGVGKGDAPDPMAQSVMQRHHDRQAFYDKMSMAKEVGLHPLVMMGMPSSNFSPVYQSGGDTDLAAVGAGVNRIAQSQVKPPDEPDNLNQSRIESAQVRLVEAQAKKAEWDALRSEFDAQDMAAPRILSGQPGNPPGSRMSNDVAQMTNLAAAQAGISPKYFSSAAKGGPIDLKQEILPPHPGQLGTGAGTDQTWINVIDQNGKITRVLNSKVIQAEFEQGATITALSKIYGPERAIEIAAVLENGGLIAGAAGGLGLAAKKAYDYFKGQANNADKRRGYGPGRGRNGWRAAGPRNE